METIKKILPAYLALVMLCGCSSNTKSEDTSSTKGNETSETTQVKGLKTVTGTFVIPEGEEDYYFPDSKSVEYTVDENGIVNSFIIHELSTIAHINEEEYIKKLEEDSNNASDDYFLPDSEIDEWEKDVIKANNISIPGFEFNLTFADLITDENISWCYSGHSKSYKVTYDIEYDASKATKSTYKAINNHEIFYIETKNNQITEKSLKEYLGESMNYTEKK